jgi:hypothetical protein
MANQPTDGKEVRTLHLEHGPCDGAKIRWDGKRLPMRIVLELEQLDGSGLIPGSHVSVEYVLRESDQANSMYTLRNEPKSV